MWKRCRSFKMRHQLLSCGVVAFVALMNAEASPSRAADIYENGIPIPIRKPVIAQDASEPLQEPAFFKITTGSTASSYFAAGEALAALISHPPGADRCRTAQRCGPAGMLAVAQTSEGALANIIAVNAGDFQSGLAPADLLSDAVNGRGAFQTSGPATNIRAIANLYVETVHLLAAKDAGISELTNLAGRRVSVGPAGSGGNLYANLLLETGRLEESITTTELDLYDAADALISGDLDAFFYLGGAPVPFVQDMLATGLVDLVGIGGAPMAVLYESRTYILPHVIANGTYQGTAQRETIGTNAVWIVNTAVSDQRIYEITRALWQDDNRETLKAGEQKFNWYELDRAASDLPIGLHPGAQRYYDEVERADMADTQTDEAPVVTEDETTNETPAAN